MYNTGTWYMYTPVPGYLYLYRVCGSESFTRVFLDLVLCSTMPAWIGRDIKPRIGTRVELDPRLGNRGTGIIIAMPADALTCTVQWDAGRRDDNLFIGQDEQFYLIEAPNAVDEHFGGQRPESLLPPHQYEGTWAGDRKKAGGMAANRGPKNENTDWLEELSNPGASRTPSSHLGRASSKPNASISNAVTTIGLSLYGTQIESLLPRGPAHLSQQLDQNDEILEVDGQPVNQYDIAQAIIGSDLVNTTVKLTVRKSLPGNPVLQVIIACCRYSGL